MIWNTSTNVVCVYDQHHILLLWMHASDGDIAIIITSSVWVSYTEVHVVILEYKYMHVIFEYKDMQK